MKLKFIFIIAAALILALLIPLYVYVTYPEVRSEEELLLEDDIAKVIPFKPPKFLVGSVIYGSQREVLVLDLKELIIERSDRHLTLKLDESRKCPLLLAPSYSEVLTREMLSRDQMINLIAKGAQMIKIALFKTQRGLFSIVLEVVVDSKHYVIASGRR